MKKERLVKLKKYFLKVILALNVTIFKFQYEVLAATAKDPTLVTKINSALKKIQGYLVKISIPATGVAIASGVLMRKFSFGDDEKMIKGRKIIVNAIVGYAIISCIDLIIKFVDSMF